MMKSKKEEAFIQVVSKYKEGLYREAYSILMNKEDAEDAISSAVLKAYTHLSDIHDMKNTKAWLFRIVINECKDMLRQRSKLKYSDVPITEVAIEDTDATQDLYEFVSQLEPQFKEVILLFYYEGFKIREIAQILDIPEGTVKSRLARAKEYLKVFIQKENL